MTASLAMFLPDFEISGIRSFSETQNDVSAAQPVVPAEPAIDVDAVRAEAYAEGEAGCTGRA
jgi:hypothetical protein